MYQSTVWPWASFSISCQEAVSFAKETLQREKVSKYMMKRKNERFFRKLIVGPFVKYAVGER